MNVLLGRGNWARPGRVLLVGCGLVGLVTNFVNENDGGAVKCQQSMKKKYQLFCFGSNQFGQLGTGSMSGDQAKPKRIDADFLEDVVAIDCFAQASAILTDNGNVCTFGRSMHGSIGQGDSVENVSSPVQLGELDGKGIVQLAMGEFHFACLSRDGSIWSCGRNWTGEVGREGDTMRPAKIDSDKKFKKVACGRTFTCAIDESGVLHTCGNARQGVLMQGNYSSLNRLTPVDANAFNGEKIADVACGQESVLVLTETGKVYSCGNTDNGKLGVGSTDNVRIYTKPQLIRSLAKEKIVSIACGDYHCACISEDGKLFTFGCGNDGALGNGSKADLAVPTQVHQLKDEKIKFVACGGAHTLAASASGKLYAFGKGRNGQLGLGDELASVAGYHTRPFEVHLFQGKKVIAVAAGRDHSMVLCQDS